jgi:hypothetical protein
LAQAQAPPPRDPRRHRLEAGDGEPDTFYVARLNAAGGPVPAGGVQLGLDHNRRELLRLALAEREQRPTGRRRIRPVAAGVELVVDAHGRGGGPLRDPVIRAVVVDGRGADAD